MEKIKARLPEMLDEIEDCKKKERNYISFYLHLVSECLRELVEPGYDAGVWTTEDFMTEVYSKYVRATKRRRFLEWVVKNMKYLAKNA